MFSIITERQIIRAILKIAIYKFIILIPLTISAEDGVRDKTRNKYSYGLLPALSFSSDKGLGYGLIFQLDDKRKEKFKPYYSSHRIVLQQSTKGIADYSYRFDSKYFLPNQMRITLKAQYRSSILQPFHGFGGAQTKYAAAYEDSSDAANYKGKFYYNYDKRFFRIDAIIQGSIIENKVRWLGGLTLLTTNIDTIKYIDFDEELLDLSKQTLLAKLVREGIIDSETYNAGSEHGIITGLIWDSRDHESTATKGVWSELLLRWVPRALGNNFSYVALTGTHRQYLSFNRKLTFAYRFGGRLMSAGAPFFSASQQDGSFEVAEVMGGSKTIRGILYNRIIGRNIAYANLELRYKIRNLFSDGFVAMLLFHDAGRSFDSVPDLPVGDKGEESDVLHRSIGTGIRVAMNSTFITRLDIGRAFDSSIDGEGIKIYIGLDWLF
ncbi:MAG: BamA/TamA family outer membrane protein [Candidatus Marinimicrobia bacterium]|nr:BamA/TamA family outer membrane protein [Candidatus Neomarinimicrobiota bacterium]